MCVGGGGLCVRGMYELLGLLYLDHFTRVGYFLHKG